jgi:hypothetical protein
MLIYSLFLRSLYCNNMHGQAIMDKFYKIRCVTFMLLHWSPIVEIFINPPLRSIDPIIQAITTASLHHGSKKTRCVYLHPTDLLRDHNMSLTKTTIRNLKQTSRQHSKTRRKTQNFIVNLLLQMKKLSLSVYGNSKNTSIQYVKMRIASSQYLRGNLGWRKDWRFAMCLIKRLHHLTCSDWRRDQMSWHHPISATKTLLK